VTDASGRILSGQTVTAFWHSVRHARPLAIGLNCALGAALMRPYIQELARVAGDTFISCYPNAGLPNPMSDTGFDETPDVTSRLLHEFAAEGLVNIVGGCCGTTPDHIAAIGKAVRAGRGTRARRQQRRLLPRSGEPPSSRCGVRGRLPVARDQRTKRCAPSPSGRSRDHTTSTHRSSPLLRFSNGISISAPAATCGRAKLRGSQPQPSPR
jgi:hypothetical protein